ncbi:CPBP family intramembrane glutamic endopeptidase [Lactococcus kimchii]|uniref:CPBP family intramembrane glutamic endopeptidase n=1 Tax=Lactococcus sp. S-13 TaxID=2507158 RepID=UPI00102376E6|nr:type II CAAX endopeptidase family protein [Lactococcus sp. S-13]RZI49540.1 CPBP family intramembrane metalloprotease [Lactococcus sp. S-13]
MERKRISTKDAWIAFVATLLIGIGYQVIGKLPLDSTVAQFIGTIWNAILAAVVGYIFLKNRFVNQFKHFSFKTLAWGIPLTIVTGALFGLVYSLLFGKPTENSVAGIITLQMVFLQVPFMLMGEELLSTNIILALEEKGLDFKWASLICGVLFALWHIPAYGFHPAQLLITLLPTRLALNYVWKKSNSVWISWLCHYLYDCLGFIQFFTK